ncbi:hypothetical protein DFH09DRAFT_1089924 [Mycena vulgaris]|nr:hypothetical protein DFH09DRAFT_1089924 [Mycena vulgaris]
MRTREEELVVSIAISQVGTTFTRTYASAAAGRERSAAGTRANPARPSAHVPRARRRPRARQQRARAHIPSIALHLQRARPLLNNKDDSPAHTPRAAQCLSPPDSLLDARLIPARIKRWLPPAHAVTDERRPPWQRYPSLPPRAWFRSAHLAGTHPTLARVYATARRIGAAYPLHTTPTRSARPWPSMPPPKQARARIDRGTNTKDGRCKTERKTRGQKARKEKGTIISVRRPSARSTRRMTDAAHRPAREHMAKRGGEACGGRGPRLRKSTNSTASTINKHPQRRPGPDLRVDGEEKREQRRESQKGVNVAQTTSKSDNAGAPHPPPPAQLFVPATHARRSTTPSYPPASPARLLTQRRPHRH